MYFKKGQLEINETILVVIIFTIMVAIGLVFFYKFSLESIKNDIKENELKQVTSMLNTFPNLAEVKCSSQLKEKDCIDATKLLSFKEIINTNKEYYFSKFGYMNISVVQIYPEVSAVEECDLNKYNKIDYPDNCLYFQPYLNKPKRSVKGQEVISTPVSLYFPDKDEYRVANLVLAKYI